MHSAGSLKMPWCTTHAVWYNESNWQYILRRKLAASQVCWTENNCKCLRNSSDTQLPSRGRCTRGAYVAFEHDTQVVKRQALNESRR